MTSITSNFLKCAAAWLFVFALSSCSSSVDDGVQTGGAGTTGGTSVGTTGGSTNGNSNNLFSMDFVEPVVLTEGNDEGANIPIVIRRQPGYTSPITITVNGVTDEDSRLISTSVLQQTLSGTESFSSINMRLAIDDLPIMPQQRIFNVDATDGVNTASIAVQVNIDPVKAPDVYLLIGQSNMVGFSNDGTKLAGPGGPDEPHPRILQLNVSKNDQYDIFSTEASYTSASANIFGDTPIVIAEDPLHVPSDPTNTGKSDAYIGMGLSFAKAALPNTTANIVLVPAAWSATSFCKSPEGGPLGQWNAQATDNPNLGNTWLFDRAVTRTNIALAETGGVLRGILWHQGESDSFDANCASVYLANLERMAKQLRLNIAPDIRGGDLRRENANIPFVLGTMSRGIDEREDLSQFWFEKQLVDDAHRTLPSKVAHAATSINDDLIPSNGYPCGNTSCIHFGAAAFREMGARYYQTLLQAVATP